MINRLTEIIVTAFFLLSCVVGVVAPKGLSILVGLAGLAGIAGIAKWWSGNHPRPTFSIGPFLLLFLLFIWAGVSSAWALDTAAFKLCLRLFFLCLLGFGLFRLLINTDNSARHKMENTFLIGYGFGILALVVGFSYSQIMGDSLWGHYYSDPLTTLNNGAVVMAVLYWPLAAILWKRYHPIWPIGGMIVLFLALLLLSSGASLLALAVGAVVMALVMLFGRLAAITIATLIVVVTLSSPILATTFLKPESIEEYSSGLPSSAAHRLLMWQFAVKKIDENPLLGWGMDASRSIPQAKFRLSPNMEIMPLHPHNAALQIRLELGWPGVILAACLIFNVFMAIFNSGLPKFQIAINTGATSAYLAVGAVSYGVWQNWWIAVAWALTAIISVGTIPENTTQSK